MWLKGLICSLLCLTVTLGVSSLTEGSAAFKSADGTILTQPGPAAPTVVDVAKKKKGKKKKKKKSTAAVAIVATAVA